jgi:hypothetical protein
MTLNYHLDLGILIVNNFYIVNLIFILFVSLIILYLTIYFIKIR